MMQSQLKNHFSKIEILLLKNFIIFLKENNALEIFYNEIKKSGNKIRAKEALFSNDYTEKHFFIENIIDRTLVWTYTPQDYYYWYALNALWKQRYKNICNYYVLYLPL